MLGKRQRSIIASVAVTILLLSSAFSLLCFHADVSGSETRPSAISCDNSFTLQNMDFIPKEEILLGSNRIASSSVIHKIGRSSVTASLLSLFAIFFLADIFPLLFFTIIISLYDEKHIRLWRIISYIHRRDGKKGEFIFESTRIIIA